MRLSAMSRASWFAAAELYRGCAKKGKRPEQSHVKAGARALDFVHRRTLTFAFASEEAAGYACS